MPHDVHLFPYNKKLAGRIYVFINIIQCTEYSAIMTATFSKTLTPDTP